MKRPEYQITYERIGGSEDIVDLSNKEDAWRARSPVHPSEIYNKKAYKENAPILVDESRLSPEEATRDHKRRSRAFRKGKLYYMGNLVMYRVV